MSTSSLQSPGTVVVDGPGVAVLPARGRRRGRGTGVSVRVGVVLLLVVLGVGALTIAALSGVRVFDVRTPSMGTAAPVGSLVVTRPATAGDLAVGEVITFRPGAGGDRYTHRIDASGPSGIRTKGDVNGSPDAWLLDPSDTVGRVVAVLPVVGWAGRALPWIVAAVALVWFATGFLAPGDLRSALRLFGAALSVAVVGAVLRPFVALQLLGTSADAGDGVARVVSTGVLPIRATVTDGGSAHLLSGGTAELAVPGDTDGVFHVASRLDLSPAGWAVLGLVCAVPVVVAFVVGRTTAPLVDAAGSAAPAAEDAR